MLRSQLRWDRKVALVAAQITRTGQNLQSLGLPSTRLPGTLVEGLMERGHQEILSADAIETIRSAAKKLTGFERRQFQAEVARKYCAGNARQVERVFGWSRSSVNKGLCEFRTGLRCLDAYALRGRKRCEQKSPCLNAQIRQIIERMIRDDARCRSSSAPRRRTVQMVLDELARTRFTEQRIPSRQTIGRIIKRLGYRLRVAKTKRT